MKLKTSIFFHSLCNKKGEYLNIINHFTSLKHQHRFLKKHFPTVFSSILPEHFGEFHLEYSNLLQELCSEIEFQHDRQMPFFTTTSKYKENPEEIHRKIVEGPHINESPSSPLVMDLIMKIMARMTKVDRMKELRDKSKLDLNNNHPSKRRRLSSEDRETWSRRQSSSSTRSGEKYTETQQRR